MLAERARFGRSLHLTTVRNEAAYFSCVCQHTQCIMDGVMVAPEAMELDAAAAAGGSGAGAPEGAAGDGATGGPSGGSDLLSPASLRALLPGTARSNGALGLGPKMTPSLWGAPPIYVCGARWRRLALRARARDCNRNPGARAQVTPTHSHLRGTRS